MGELSALLAREWTLCKRWTLAISALIAVGYAMLFVLCEAPDRYRLLCDPLLLRRVAVTGPMLLGAALSYRSFASEMRSATWDGLLLLPAPRSAILGAKLSFALVAITHATVAPMLALWAVVSSLSIVGGPVLTLRQLFTESILGRSLLVGLCSYVAGASASILLRSARTLFWVPATGPLLLFLAMSKEGSSEGQPTPRVAALCVAFAVAGLVHLWREVRETGAGASAPLRALRGLSATPIAAAALVFCAVIAADLFRERPRDEPARERWSAPAFTRDGHIAQLPYGRSALSLNSLRAPEIARERSGRFWTPELVGHELQLFVHKRDNVLLAYGMRSGRAMGCVGRDGFRPSNCAPFDSRPSFQSGEHPLVITRSGIQLVDEEAPALREAYRGRVDRITRLFDDDDGFALQSGADLVILRSRPLPEQSEDERADEHPDESEDERADEPPDAQQSNAPSFELHAAVACAGAGVYGDITSVAVDSTFVALIAQRPHSDRETLIVCRDAAITEHVETDARRAPPWREPSRREVFTAMALGPAGAFALRPPTEYYVNGESVTAPRTPFRSLFTASFALSVLCVIAERRAAKRLTAGVALTAVLALLCGPSFALGYAAMRWASARARR